MTTPRLRILLVEDSPADAELIAATLVQDGVACDCDRVATRDTFLARLDGPYDLIVSDFSLPAFDGITAQEIARRRRPDLPFVFVSGTMGEEVVIERLKAGATDFVLKHRLARLPGAVRRALQEARDRKERDRAREEVRRLHAELEQRVEERTHQLAEARREAERANRAKSEFLSRMSHDLRTPLNAILGFAQLLDTDPSLGDEQIENVRQILKGGSHLLELINEVLDIARIEAGLLALSIEPLQVSEVLSEVVDLMRPLASARRVSVAVHLNHDLQVLADRSRFRQILLNLLGNAVKYNRVGGDVRVTAERVAGRIRIRVSDTGPGIPEGKRALLFQPFERLGAERDTVEGTGLGLAVAKGLVEAMSGAIGIEVPAAGATFWIDLPEAERQPSPEEGDGDPVQRERGTVLYIEDNRLNVRLLERLLGRRPNVRLVTAANGADGIALAVQEKPSLILLDLHLPDISGEDVLRRLRSDPRTAQIPIAVLSADAIQSQRDRLMRTGVQAYFTKPLVLASLLELIDTYLQPPARSETT